MYVCVCVCVCDQSVPQLLLIQSMRCVGTSYIIDLSLRFAHVAPPGDGVPGCWWTGVSKPALEALNILEGCFHLYNGNYPSH